MHPITRATVASCLVLLVGVPLFVFRGYPGAEVWRITWLAMVVGPLWAIYVPREFVAAMQYHPWTPPRILTEGNDA